MLLSASLWKPNLFYLLHVLLQTWFLNIHLILVPGVSACEVSVSVSSGFLTWQCETADQVCVVTVWHLCVCDVAVWSWSFHLVCSSKPILVAVCLQSWQIMDAFVSAELTSLHDVTTPLISDRMMSHYIQGWRQNEWKHRMIQF